jgi:hypothetical protein
MFFLLICHFLNLATAQNAANSDLASHDPGLNNQIFGYSDEIQFFFKLNMLQTHAWNVQIIFTYTVNTRPIFHGKLSVLA